MQTYELMECLQELGRDNTLPTKQALLLEEHKMRLRLALADQGGGQQHSQQVGGLVNSET